MYQKRLHPLTDQTLCSPPNEQNQSKMQFVCWFQSNALANTCLFVMQLYLIVSNPEMWKQFSMIWLMLQVYIKNSTKEAYYEISSSLLALENGELEEYWYKVLVDVTTSVQRHNLVWRKKTRLEELAKWLIFHQPILFLVNALPSWVFYLGRDLFEITLLVVTTIGYTDKDDAPLALTCKARPQEAECFVKFLLWKTMAKFTEYLMIIPSSNHEFLFVFQRLVPILFIHLTSTWFVIAFLLQHLMIQITSVHSSYLELHTGDITGDSFLLSRIYWWISWILLSMAIAWRFSTIWSMPQRKIKSKVVEVIAQQYGDSNPPCSKITALSSELGWGHSGYHSCCFALQCHQRKFSSRVFDLCFEWKIDWDSSKI